MAGLFADRRRLGLLIAFFTAMLFGLYPPATRAVYADGGNVAFLLVAITWTRALGLALYCLIRRKPVFNTKAGRKDALIGGVLQGMSATGVAAALVFLPGPLVIITLFSHTLMLLLFLAWKREIKLDAVTVFTTIIALGGLSLVLDLWHVQPVGHLWGIGLAFMSALVIVFRSYVYERQTRTRNPAAVGAENFIVAALTTLLVWFYQAPQLPHTASTYGWVALACIVSALGTFGMFFGIAYLGAFRWSLYAKVEPVFTAIFSALLIGEFLKPSQYVGVVVVLASLALYQTVDQRRAKKVNVAAVE